MLDVNFINIDVYPIDKHRHVVRQLLRKVSGYIYASTDHWNGLIHRVLNILLYLQERFFTLADFRHDVTFHQHGDVVQGRGDVW